MQDAAKSVVVKRFADRFPVLEKRSARRDRAALKNAATVDIYPAELRMGRQCR